MRGVGECASDNGGRVAAGRAAGVLRPGVALATPRLTLG